MTTTHDLHVVDTRPLIPPALLHRDLPIDPTALETVATARSRIQAILRGLDRRLLVIVGPLFCARRGGSSRLRPSSCASA
jgi:3-deoxy-7-phosphoheptulonate synthase